MFGILGAVLVIAGAYLGWKSLLHRNMGSSVLMDLAATAVVLLGCFLIALSGMDWLLPILVLRWAA